MEEADISRIKILGEKVNVTLYTIPACSATALVRNHLDRNFIDYTIIDISRDRAAYAFIREQGFTESPIIDTGDQMWSGYQPAKMKEVFSI
jgi:glutaredoxin-like protein NrdH